jgi:hypothetical protein
MNELIHRTVEREVSLLIEPDATPLLPMKIRLDGVTIAWFDVCLVFDLMMDELEKLEEPARFLGLDRRSYAAKNIHRLYVEWMDKRDEAD